MENIINKIAADAEAETSALLASAKDDAQRRIERAKAEISANAESALDKAKRAAEVANKAASIQANTAARRESMLARQTVIDEVFADVRKQLVGLNAKDAQTLVAALVKKYGTTGDTVIVSKNDDKKITDTFIKGLPTKNLKRVTSDKFDGGIIIENPSYERSLTVDELLTTLRDKVELEVAKILF